MSRARAAVILAAGHGTRMKSAVSKVLHPVAGRPMLHWSIALAKSLSCERIIVVHGAHNIDVKTQATALLGEGSTALQDPPSGTGHAVACAQASLAGFEGDVIVLYADTPLIGSATAAAAFEALEAGASVAVLGFEAVDPGSYGRLIENAAGDLEAIVEAKEATPDQLAVRLCNSGVMAVPSALLFELLTHVTNDNAKGEYYLTDVVALAVSRGLRAKAVACSETEVLGVNSRVELAQAEAAFQAAKRRQLLVEGVTMTAPETVFFAYDTQVGNDVTIEPNVVFGPGVRIESGATIKAFCHLDGCSVEAGAVIGPFARLRPGSAIEADVRVGNFVEIKNTRMGKGAKANHLAYIGDADVGAGANLGAGTITCNYDGYLKHKTTIGEGAFIGSDTMLVAPVNVGAGANTGSGSTITRDVPAGALAVERGELRIVEGAATRYRARKAAEKAAKKATS